MHKKILLSLLFCLSLNFILPSCKLFKKASKAESAQQKADKKKESDRRNREKIQKENVKKIYGRQTKETRKRMKANRAKSDRINKGLPEKQRRTFRLNWLKKPKWWR